VATTRLQIYNGALQIIGRSSIASLTVNEEGRRLLDDVWNDGGVQFCLEQGMWKFAIRTQMLDYDSSVTPTFGYRRAFAKGSDWCATTSICQDEYFNSPLLRYRDEIDHIWADLDRFYVSFVSNHVDFGLNLGNWPATFTQYVKTYFAARIALRATGDKALAEKLNAPRGLLDMACSQAKNNDAQNDPPRFPPPSSWIVARRRQSQGQWRDGGSRSNLIG